MDESQKELYLTSLTFAAINHRELSPVEQRFITRMRDRYPGRCTALDAEVARDLRNSPRYQRSLVK